MFSLKSIFTFFIFVPMLTLASADSAIVLHEVNIHGFRSEEKVIGLKQFQIDSISKIFNRFSSVANLLIENNLYIKNNGPSQLATSSMRGGSSYHTGVLWNGMNFVDPMTGVSDLSMIRSFLFDQIAIQYGGSSSITGSGNLSGSILLSENKKFNSGWNGSIGSSYNSTGNTIVNGHAAYGSDKSYTIVRAFNENALNKYHFTEDKTEKIQQNGHSLQRGVSVNQAIKTGANSLFEILGWYQYANRKITPAIFQTYSNAVQRDENFRTAVSWKKSGRTTLNIRSAYFNDKLYYNDNSLPAPSESHTQTWMNEADIRYQISQHHTAGVMLNYTNTTARTADYGSTQLIHRKWINGYYNYRSTNEKLEVGLSVRKEYFSLMQSPLVYTIGANHFSRYFNSRISFSKLHRNPTLNDLFWSPGGNPNLKAESGYGGEAGTVFNATELIFPKNSKNNLQLGGTMYLRRISNWIQWTPVNGLIWSPQNLDEVLSRGIESTIDYRFSGRKFKLDLTFNFATTISTKEKSSIANDQSLHRQLIYVPKYSATTSIQVHYQQFSVRILNCYNSYRFTTSDHSFYLKPFQFTNVECIYHSNIATVPIELYVSSQNVMNTDFSYMYNRPQPLRNFQFGIVLHLISNKKSDK